MNLYTELLNIKAETLSPEDDDYEERLLEVATLFRGFDVALTEFLVEQGYIGAPMDVGEKAKFLREKFKVANVKLPRDFKEWFVQGKKISRKTVFQICFAFGLGVRETNDFFRCVQLERGFDCHTVIEVVYYFCMKNGFSYSDAQDMIEKISIPKKVKSLPKSDILYTGTIMEYIDSIKDKEQFIQYIRENIDDFQYNNATIIKYIQKLWREIAKEDGLAVKEGQLIDAICNRFENKRKKGIIDTRSSEVANEEVKFQEKEVKPEDYVIAKENSSTWTVFAQIIGLRNYLEHEYATKYDRSLSSVLISSKLMPLNAHYCFPSQHNIDKLLRGELGDNELMRKMLIFLVFYTYWVKRIISSNNLFYTATHTDSERCLETINQYLLDAGYQELYAGNPYDWLFLWALNDEHPLEAFRIYMGEVFANKSEQLEE